MTNEAFLWWNQLILKENNDNEPFIIIQEQFTTYLSKISPFLHSQIFFFYNSNNYWNKLQNIFEKLCNLKLNYEIKNNFKNFIIDLYYYKNLIYPNSINSIINFIEKFHFNPIGEFFSTFVL